jgi:hypothetical protein
MQQAIEKLFTQKTAIDFDGTGFVEVCSARVRRLLPHVLGRRSCALRTSLQEQGKVSFFHQDQPYYLLFFFFVFRCEHICCKKGVPLKRAKKRLMGTNTLSENPLHNPSTLDRFRNNEPCELVNTWKDTGSESSDDIPLALEDKQFKGVSHFDNFMDVEAEDGEESEDEVPLIRRKRRRILSLDGEDDHKKDHAGGWNDDDFEDLPPAEVLIKDSKNERKRKHLKDDDSVSFADDTFSDFDVRIVDELEAAMFKNADGTEKVQATAVSPPLFSSDDEDESCKKPQRKPTSSIMKQDSDWSFTSQSAETASGSQKKSPVDRELLFGSQGLASSYRAGKKSPLDQLNELHRRTRSDKMKPWTSGGSNNSERPKAFSSVSSSQPVMPLKSSQFLQKSYDKPWLSSQPTPSVSCGDLSQRKSSRLPIIDVFDDNEIENSCQPSSYPTPKTNPRTKANQIKSTTFVELDGVKPVFNLNLGKENHVDSLSIKRHDACSPLLFDGDDYGDLNSRSSSPELWAAEPIKSKVATESASATKFTKPWESTSRPSLQDRAQEKPIINNTTTMDTLKNQPSTASSSKDMRGLMRSLGDWVASLNVDIVDDEPNASPSFGGSSHEKTGIMTIGSNASNIATNSRPPSNTRFDEPLQPKYVKSLSEFF